MKTPQKENIETEYKLRILEEVFNVVLEKNKGLIELPDDSQMEEIRKKVANELNSENQEFEIAYSN